MALVLAAALSPLPRAAAQAGTDLTPEELIKTAQGAYEAADWVQAEALFASLIQTYATTPDLVETVRRARPLLVTTRLRQKKYDEETVSLLGEVLSDPRLDPVAADELAFWRGLCHVQTGAFAEARAALSDYYAGKAPGADALPEPARRVRAGRRAESLLLHAACLLQENSPAEAAAFLAPHIPVLREHKQLEAAGRAVVLRLHALLAANDETAAATLVRDTQPRLGEITQVVAFHTLCLQLGSRLLETGRHHEAIACLQRVWPRDQILTHQRSSQTQFSKRLEQARRSPGQEALVFQLEGLVKRLQRETEQFSTTETFDSALRLRVAAAYRELGRHREAALVLENMLARLPPDPVVEKAALSLIQSWMQVERWPRAVAAADAFLEQFNRPSHPDVPMVRFLKASALHADRRPHEAELAFAAVHQLHRDHDLAPRALFLEGICLLEQDLHREALDAFAETAERYPKSDVLEDCDYWAGMALSFDKRHAEARDRMRTHLTEYRDRGRHVTEARFRIAFSTFGLAEYSEAVAELRPFIAAHPGSPLAEEAKLLLGDALGALGRIDDAVAAYHSVDRAANARFHEEAIFRVGNAYKVSEQPDALRAHFEGFMADHPTSQRLAEAVYWIGQSHQQAGRPEAARQAYWDVLATHGDTATSHGIEDILSALPRLYPGEAGREELIPKLEALAAATRDTKPTLSLRARWARAQVLAKNEPERARADLVDARPLLAPRHHHPRLIADCADALRESGRSQDARTLYRELRKWHPRALEKDRAFLGLGLLALEEHQPADALAQFARFEQETLGSPLLGEVARLKAGIFEDQGQFDQAQAEQERLLEMPMVPRQLKARTLLKLGDLMARQREDLKSTAYYERVYVSYGKYLPEVATAYLKRATALERLNHDAAAMDVWRELAGRTDLANLPEAGEARRRLDELDPGWHDRIPPASSTAAIPASPAPPPSS
jgi:TolA-binding protein